MRQYTIMLATEVGKWAAGALGLDVATLAIRHPRVPYTFSAATRLMVATVEPMPLRRASLKVIIRSAFSRK